MKENNIEQNNPLDDTYETFNINKMKELQTYSTKNEVEKMLILKDGRILTLQIYFDEVEEMFFKLTVYSLKKGFTYDINMDYERIYQWYQMDDCNIIIQTHKTNQISIIKIKTNNIETIWTFEKETRTIDKLLNNNFLINVIVGKEIIKNKKFNKKEDEIYKYENGKLIFFKNIEKFKKDKEITNFCQVGDNEYVYYAKLKGKMYGQNDFLIFFDMQNESVIKK